MTSNICSCESCALEDYIRGEGAGVEIKKMKQEKYIDTR